MVKEAWMYRSKDTIASLRKELVADSISRARLMEKLLRLVRDQERTKTLDTLRATRSSAEREGR